jgi:four helix bundle protein
VVPECERSGQTKEFARFLDMSIKSDNELEYHLLESRDLDLLALPIWKGFTDETIEIRKMIFVYRRKVLQSPRNRESED